ISHIGNIGPIRFQRIKKYFSNLADFWQANLIDIINSGIEEAVAHKIIINRNQIDLEKVWQTHQDANIKLLSINNPNYPAQLKQIFDPPFLLFYRGDINILNKTALAVVGARKYTSYGQQATHSVVSKLASSGLVIISGLALGIDAIAHQATLEASGLTVGVLGASVAQKEIYPQSNYHLSEKIIANGGCLISEYPIGTIPLKPNFPRRNRIVSGLAKGVLVIEAQQDSGSLITAKCALEQNRDVFAIPGTIFSPYSLGTNDLIKKGAKLVSDAQDILEEFDIQEIATYPTTKTSTLSEAESTVTKFLSKEKTHINLIAQKSNLAIANLLSILTILELKGIVKDLGGKNYILCK
ncbi:MAG: DNA-processing protein DprA, partial [bacterium]